MRFGSKYILKWRQGMRLASKCILKWRQGMRLASKYILKWRQGCVWHPNTYLDAILWSNIVLMISQLRPKLFMIDSGSWGSIMDAKFCLWIIENAIQVCIWMPNAYLASDTKNLHRMCKKTETDVFWHNLFWHFFAKTVKKKIVFYTP